MSDSESDQEDISQKVEHYTGPVEDAWKMKIPEFKPEDNKHGKEKYSQKMSSKKREELKINYLQDYRKKAHFQHYSLNIVRNI